MPTIIRTARRSLCILIIATLSTTATAADSLYQTYLLAQERDPSLRAAAAARDAALEIKPQSRAVLLPNVGIGSSIERNSYDPRSGGETTYSTNKNYSISLTQPVFRWDRWVALGQADERVLQAQAEYGAAEQDLMLRVAERYFAVLTAQDALRVAQREKDSIGRQLEQAQQRFEVGLSAITDVQEAQARYDSTVAAEIRAEDQLASSYEQLREITGELNQNLAVLRDSDFKLITPDPQDQQAWVDTALQQNATLVAARAGSEAARQEIQRARAGHYPTLDATASYAYQDSNFGGIAAIERNDGSVGLELSLPLYQGGLVNSRTREARYLFDEARERLDVTQRSIERQTRDAYRGVITGISEVRARDQARTSSATALDAATTGYEVGTRTIVDVLDAQSALSQAELSLSESRYNYLLNTLRLKQAAGTLAPEDMQQLDDWLQMDTAAATPSGG